MYGDFLLRGVYDNPVDSYGSPADDGGGEDDGHHDGHAVQAAIVSLSDIFMRDLDFDIDAIPVQPTP